MDVRHLECFLAVAEAQSFRRAAARLHLAQPSVSEAVRRLEREVGGPLFDRSRRQIRLTSLGELFVPEARAALDRITEAYERARSAARDARTTLRVGFFGSTLADADPLLEAFRTAHPDVDVRLSEIDFSDHLAPLRQHRVDVAVLRLPVQENDLTVGPVIAETGRVLAVPVWHRFARRDHVDLEDCAAETFLSVPSSAPGYWLDVQVPTHTPRGLAIRRHGTAATVHEALSLVAAGRAVHPMVTTTADYYRRPDVTYVPLRAPALQTALVWRAGDPNPLIQAISQLAARLAAQRDPRRPTPRAGRLAGDAG